MWTNTGHGKLKRHNFLLETHDLRENCAPLTCYFKFEVRQGILAVGTHDRQGGRERLKKEPQKDTIPETPPDSHLLLPARFQLPVLTPLLQTAPSSKNRTLISNSHNASPLGSKYLIQGAAEDCRGRGGCRRLSSSKGSTSDCQRTDISPLWQCLPMASLQGHCSAATHLQVPN